MLLGYDWNVTLVAVQKPTKEQHVPVFQTLMKEH